MTIHKEGYSTIGVVLAADAAICFALYYFGVSAMINNVVYAVLAVLVLVLSWRKGFFRCLFSIPSWRHV